MLESSVASNVGQMVPDYELLKRIGGGAYGEVWLARSKATGALRAAKIVWRDKFEDERPFQREFEGIQRFEAISRGHPGQLALFHIGRNEEQRCFYYVMELADAVENPKSETRNSNSIPSPRTGTETALSSGAVSKSGFGDSSTYEPHTLRADLAQGRLPTERVLEIGLALSEALEHLHKNGLVHRDVKPSNVIFVNRRPKLADIGLVTDASDQCSIVGTEGYLPPEGPGTPQADIFALGKVLYEAVTGLDRREFPRLPENLRSWPDAGQVFELNEVLLKACASDPKERYAGVDAMVADLQCLRQGKSVKRRRNLQWWWAVSKKAGTGLGIGGAVVIAAAAIVRGIGPSDPYPEGRPSTNSEANIYCDKAMQILRDDNFLQLTQAYAYFTNAISLDPYFVRPYVGLLQMALREPLSAPEQEALLKQASAKLHELAPSLGATSVADSIIHYNHGDLLAAKRYGQKAIKANPNYELGHTWYAYMLAHWKRSVEARKELQRSEQLTPSKAIVYLVLGQTYQAERDYTNAIKYYEMGLQLCNRHQPPALGWLGHAYRACGDYTNSIKFHEEEAVLTSDDPAKATNFWNHVREAFAKEGPDGYWKLAVTNGEKWSWPPYSMARAHIHLGDTNSALDLLQKSLETHERVGAERAVNDVLLDESWDGLKDNPRFQKLIKDAGFLEVMAH